MLAMIKIPPPYTNRIATGDIKVKRSQRGVVGCITALLVLCGKILEYHCSNNFGSAFEKFLGNCFSTFLASINFYLVIVFTRQVKLHLNFLFKSCIRVILNRSIKEPTATLSSKVNNSEKALICFCAFQCYLVSSSQ